MNLIHWDTLEPRQRRVLEFALANQNRAIEREGASAYYEYVADAEEIRELERARKALVEVALGGGRE